MVFECDHLKKGRQLFLSAPPPDKILARPMTPTGSPGVARHGGNQ